MLNVAPTQHDLEEADCWFDVDKVGGHPGMTAFKREARWRQHRWAVEIADIHSFGSHLGGRSGEDGIREEVSNGSRLRPVDAERGENFLTGQIFEVAKQRVVSKQLYETLDSKRLFDNLLSSMPMAFNLFGEASLPQHGVSREALAELFGVEPAVESDIVFEWSPGRRDTAYTRDRTAFDVALRLGRADGPRTVVGIETKFHEHSVREKKPPLDNGSKVAAYQDQTDFLIDVAEKSGAFQEGWQDHVLDTDLRQIWRDHLLALSMRSHAAWTGATKYVLVYPARNISFAEAAERYSTLLDDGSGSFQAFTMEEVVGAAFAHGGSTRDRFSRRYLW